MLTNNPGHNLSIQIYPMKQINENLLKLFICPGDAHTQPNTYILKNYKKYIGISISHTKALSNNIQRKKSGEKTMKREKNKRKHINFILLKL